MSNEQHMVIDVDKELHEEGIKDNAYHELEQNFTQLINELSQDPNTEKFKDQFDRLQNTFNLAFANEKKLMKIYRDLKKDHNELLRALQKANSYVQDLQIEREALQKKLKDKNEKEAQLKEEKKQRGPSSN